MFFLFLASPLHEYERDMAKMAGFLKTEKSTLTNIANTSNANAREALSIVFPELIRFPHLKDLI